MPSAEDHSQLEDPEVLWALDLFRSKMTPSEWRERRNAIERYMNELLKAKWGYNPALPLASISYKEDRIGWYLWLAEAYLFRRYEYEFLQGSRVIPFLKGLGMRSRDLEMVEALEERAVRIVRRDTDSPDGGLFEMLVAALYVRNGASSVAFVPPSPSEKMPDLQATLDDESVFIECKRLAEVSQYSRLEREARTTQWRPLSRWLSERRISVVLDVTFHREVVSYRSDNLLDAIRSKEDKLTSANVLFDDGDITIAAKPLDLEQVRTHLKTHHVKFPSSFFNQLLSGEHRKDGGFSAVFEAQMAHFEGTTVLNKYVDDIRYAACAHWSCDAERAIEAKARDIRGHLAEAFQQIPDNKLGIVHIGIESNDGWDVEKERIERIFRTVPAFDARGKQVEWIYLHFFEPQSPPDEDWAIEETASSFSLGDPRIRPLNPRTLVVPADAARWRGFPWDRDGELKDVRS